MIFDLFLSKISSLQRKDYKNYLCEKTPLRKYNFGAKVFLKKAKQLHEIKKFKKKFTCEDRPAEGSEDSLGDKEVSAANAVDDEVHSFWLDLFQPRFVVDETENLVHTIFFDGRVLFLSGSCAENFYLGHRVRQLRRRPADTACEIITNATSNKKLIS